MAQRLWNKADFTARSVDEGVSFREPNVHKALPPYCVRSKGVYGVYPHIDRALYQRVAAMKRSCNGTLWCKRRPWHPLTPTWRHVKLFVFPHHLPATDGY